MNSQESFELVVFDCDGVLVDSEVIAVRVDQLVLADLGWELELEEIVERFVGRSEADFVAAVEERLGKELDQGWDGSTSPGTGPRSSATWRIFSATEVRNGKPAPDLFLHAAGSLGAEPERCAVVEDSAHGVQAARAAGMHVFAYAGGVTPAGRLAGAGTTVFHDMRHLPELIAAGRPG